MEGGKVANKRVWHSMSLSMMPSRDVSAWTDTTKTKTSIAVLAI